MTLRPLPRSRLDRIAPLLLNGSALVVLVPATDDMAWAAEAAWGVARAAAGGGSGKRREVALVDLCLEAPLLHIGKHAAAAPGITEAFTHETSLNDLAQDIDGVHFLPAGTPESDAITVRSAARWRRLHAGFRNEGALLLVCLPADHLNELGADPEGVIALAPGGVDLGSTTGRALLAARDRGVELLGVVRERWSAATPAMPATGRPRVRHGLVAFGLAAAVTAALIVATNKPGTPVAPAAPAPAPGARETFGTARAPASAEPTIPLPMLSAADSSGWMLQLAAYGAPGRALSHVDRLVAADLPAVVSPLTPDVSGAVWYRVLAGMYRTREDAMAARRTLWRRGLAARGEGTPVFAPYSVALTRPNDADRLRGAGLAGVRWGQRGPVLVGAFEHPEAASVTMTALQHAGIAATLIQRTDRTQ
ncbi:MAG TPA: SPOR domain-containing protein [Gemmatimonadales bacterium]|nr:SPOR domain-containing protein [Gemmatimonadales bacterium]